MEIKCLNQIISQEDTFADTFADIFAKRSQTQP